MGQNRGLVLFTKIDPCIFKSPSTITVLCHSVLELIIERLQEARIPTKQNASLVQYYPFRNVSHSRPSPSLHSHEGPFLVNGQMPVSAEPGWGVKEQGQSGGESCPPPASPAWPGGNIGQLFPDLLFHKKPETQIWSEISQFLNLGNEFKKKKKTTMPDISFVHTLDPALGPQIMTPALVRLYCKIEGWNWSVLICVHH